MPTRPSSRGTNGSLRRVSVLESCRFTVRILPAGSEVGGDREADGDGEDALAPAGEAEALGRLGSDPRRCRLHGEHAGQVGAHLADVVAEARLVAEDGDGHVHGGPAAGRDHLGDLPAEIHAGGALEGGVVLREVRPEVVEAGRAEQRVAGGVGDHVAVGVAVQATIELDGHPTEDQRATFDQRMDVDALPDPHRLGDHGGLLVRVSSASATSRSRAVVTFRFSWLPGTTWTGWPANSTSAASSEASTPSSMALRCAASRASRTKSCGVWTARSWSRSTIPRERWSSSTRRTVSTTGTPGTTPAGRRGSGDPPEGSGESRRSAPMGRGVPRWDGSPATARERAGGVVHGDEGGPGRHGCKAGRDARLAGRPAGDDRDHLGEALVNEQLGAGAQRVRVRHHHHRGHAVVGLHRLDRVDQQRPAGQPHQRLGALASEAPPDAGGGHDDADGWRRRGRMGGAVYDSSASSSIRMAFSSSQWHASTSSETRIWRERCSMRFSPADRPFSRSRTVRSRTTSATWKMSPDWRRSMLPLKRRLQLPWVEDSPVRRISKTPSTSSELQTSRMPTSWQLSRGTMRVRSPYVSLRTRYSRVSPPTSRSCSPSTTAAPCCG